MSNPENIPAGGSKYHWWYDASKAGARNPPPTAMTGSPPEGGPRRLSLTSMFLGNPDSIPGSPTYKPERRDSLTKMYNLSDFGTPDD